MSDEDNIEVYVNFYPGTRGSPLDIGATYITEESADKAQTKNPKRIGKAVKITLQRPFLTMEDQPSLTMQMEEE